MDCIFEGSCPSRRKRSVECAIWQMIEAHKGLNPYFLLPQHYECDTVLAYWSHFQQIWVNTLKKKKDVPDKGIMVGQIYPREFPSDQSPGSTKSVSKCGEFSFCFFASELCAVLGDAAFSANMHGMKNRSYLPSNI